jgi:hypothetical protein
MRGVICELTAAWHYGASVLLVNSSSQAFCAQVNPWALTRPILSCTYYTSCQFTSSTSRESKVVDDKVVILRLTSRKELPMVLEGVGDMVVKKPS